MSVHATPAVHLYVHSPTAMFKARVNEPTAVTYPITSIAFDGVTLGVYSDIEVDMTLLLGSADGLDDYGRVRVQSSPTSTSIPVGRISQGVEDGTLTIVDNAYITIYLDDFRVWSKLPYQDPSGVDYKDSNITVDAYMTDIPPVANTGPGFAGYTSAGIITVQFPGGGADLSYAMADGATIVSYAWDVQDGTITVGTIASAVITATFPAGFRYVSLEVVDSNGKEHTARCPVLAVNAAADVTIPTAIVESQRLTQMGQTLRVNLPANLPRTTYPDGALVMLWWDAAASPGDRSHMKFCGWIQSETAAHRATRTGLVRETVLECVDVAGRLDTLPGFPQALERSADVAWYYSPTLDINKALHYLLHWHSTALTVADFFLPPTGDDYPSMRLDSTGASLYDQVNSRALSMVPDHLLCCNAQGQLSVLEDWMLVDVGDRPTVAAILLEDDYGDLSFPYTRPPRVHVLRSSAVVCSTDWLMLGGEETLPLAFSVAPGTAFSQGTNEQIEAEGLTISQDDLNVSAGHKYARLNARFGPARLSILDLTDLWDYEPALMQRIQLNISAASAAQRGLPFTTVNTMIKELNIRYNASRGGLGIEADATLELETSGFPALTHIPETTEDPGDFETPPIPPPTTPPSMGLLEGVELVAGIGLDGYVYRTFNFQNATPTWDRVDLLMDAPFYTWVVDPFSPGYVETGETEINGWVANETSICRVEDLFGAPVATEVFSFPVVADIDFFHWRSIQASFGAYFAEGANPWLVCVSYYGDTSGHEGTWATYSTDGGSTWADEVQISANFNSATATRFMPIGLYTSPKTPGLAYTIAYGEGNADPTKLPIWGIWDSETSTASYTGPQSSYEATSSIHLVGDTAEIQKSKDLYMIPPANAVRVVLACRWEAQASFNGVGNPDMIFGYTLNEAATVGRSSTLAFDNPDIDPPDSDSNAQDFTVTWTYGGAGDWPVNRSSIIGTPIIGHGNPDGCRFEHNLHGNGTAGTEDQQGSIYTRATVTEIEFDGAVIYNPPTASAALYKTTDWGATWVAVTDFIDAGQGAGGTIHIPWILNADEQLAYYGSLDNAGTDQFRLMQNSGAVQTDISPTSGAIDYGVNSYGFGIRAYDSDRQFLALGGFGNDTSNSPADDKVGLWVSSNAGAAWTQILAPAAVANAPRGLQIAFSGTDPDVLFAWGGKSDATLASIYYSTNFGTALSSKEGNMNSLGVATLIGIAGGPIT